MDRQRPHQHDITSVRHTVHGSAHLNSGAKLMVHERAVEMRTRDHTQRALLGAARIQVHTKDRNLINHRSRRPTVRLAILHRPRAESVDIVPLLHCDDRILMPRHEPVRGWRLVEDDGSNDADPFATDLPRERGNARPAQNLAKPRLALKHAPNTGFASLVSREEMFYKTDDVTDIVRRDDGAGRRVSVLPKVCLHVHRARYAPSLRSIRHGTQAQ